MRTYLFLLLLATSSILVAQTKTKKKDSLPDGWKSKGLAELLFSQSAFNKEWQGGGTSNVAIHLHGTPDLPLDLVLLPQKIKNLYVKQPTDSS